MKAIFLTEELTSHGFWVKLSGLDIERFRRNPVLLYDHDGHRPAIGKINNLRVEKGQLIGEVEFDEADELGNELKRKYEKGYMQGFSVGIEPKEWSEDGKDIKQGQTYPTITKAELFEISAVNIPSDKNAVVLYNKDYIRLSADTVFKPIQNTYEMENKIKLLSALATLLGLSLNADERDIEKAIRKLKADNERSDKELKELKAELESLQKAYAVAIVELGFERGVISQANKGHFVKLAMREPELTLELVKEKGEKENKALLSSQIKRETPGKKTVKWAELSEKELRELKAKDYETYRKLYYDHYGLYPEEV